MKFNLEIFLYFLKSFKIEGQSGRNRRTWQTGQTRSQMGHRKGRLIKNSVQIRLHRLLQKQESQLLQNSTQRLQRSKIQGWSSNQMERKSINTWNRRKSRHPASHTKRARTSTSWAMKCQYNLSIKVQWWKARFITFMMSRVAYRCRRFQ